MKKIERRKFETSYDERRTTNERTKKNWYYYTILIIFLFYKSRPITHHLIKRVQQLPNPYPLFSVYSQHLPQQTYKLSTVVLPYSILKRFINVFIYLFVMVYLLIRK